MAPVRTFVAATALVAVSLVISGCGTPAANVKPIKLTMWGVTESSGDIAPLIAAVTASHPNVRVDYVQKDTETYATDLVEALAAGRGPDIFAFPAGQVRRWQDLLQPAPQKYALPVYYTKKTLLSRQQVVAEQTYDSLTPRQVESRFVRTVANDSLANGQLYGLPVAVDTLMLAYNQALLDGSRVAQAPDDWVTFKDAVVKLTQRDTAGNLQQSGAAMGTGSNITNAAALASLLMLQGGVSFPVNDEPVLTGRGETLPAAEALRFYADFSQSSRETYSWNTRLANDREALAAGRVAMTFLTPIQVAQLRQQQPSLPLTVTGVPQLGGAAPAAVADYWLYGVAKASKDGQRVWGVLQQLATNEAALAKFAATSKRGPTLRTVATKLQTNDNPEVVALADQALIAQPWFYGYDKPAAERVFASVLDRVATASVTIDQALAELNRQLRLTFQPST